MSIISINRFPWFLLLLTAVVLLWPCRQVFADKVKSTEHIVQLDIEGAIGPATSDYLERNMDRALENGAKRLTVTMDTLIFET